jgi:aspartate/tyrosine/aromatic aminotransferase
MPRGRKSGAENWITEKGLLQIEQWAREKITDKDIAEKKMKVSESTFSDWKRQYPAIVGALKKGRAPVAEEIEKSFYDICGIQEYKETTEEITYDSNNNVISKHKRIVTKQAPPNVTALIFALKNLMPERYRDRPQDAISDAKQIVLYITPREPKDEHT